MIVQLHLYGYIFLIVTKQWSFESYSLFLIQTFVTILCNEIYVIYNHQGLRESPDRLCTNKPFYYF